MAVPHRKRLRLWRLPMRALSISRLFLGGRIDDLGRLPRYSGFFLMGAVAIWVPITGYLATARLSYTSELSLILPGAGASASVNLDRIGQASSFANSPFASNSISPTETYKRLLGADRILASAAQSLALDRAAFGKPRIQLVDLTGLIHIALTGPSAEAAQARGDALLSAFFSEIDKLRNDELTTREDGGRGAIADYRTAIQKTRAQIAALQRETGLISTAQYAALVTETDRIRARVQELGTDLREKSEAVAALQSTLAITPRLAAATLRLHADSAFNALARDMSDQGAKLARLRGQFGPNHPEVEAAAQAAAATRDRTAARAQALTGLPLDVAQALDLSTSGNRPALLADLVRQEADRQGRAAEYEALSAELKRNDARVLELIDPAAKLEDLQRDFSVAEAVFASAMARAESSKTDLYASYPLVQVLENPSLPDRPSSPKRKLAIAAGGAATFFLLIGLVLGWIRRPLIGRLLVRSDPAAQVTEA
ncbi:hypothetical protein FGG78_25230 [Thioclava sp. BHET1]|nr:hypothetical protein FGG78_25230 [Thioclava sp. BHET1]